jgi:hypothetical protein
MKNRLPILAIVALTLSASSTAYADVHLNVDVNPFGWWAPRPPVVYEPPRYYAPPPVVYFGHDHWGDHRDGRGRHNDRGRGEHHDEGGGRRGH